jgi:hypothetical protein
MYQSYILILYHNFINYIITNIKKEHSFISKFKYY